jgi:phosphoribosylaminoimidazolecarboxamide formyltransferase/IMP cyclohydrolase
MRTAASGRTRRFAAASSRRDRAAIWRPPGLGGLSTSWSSTCIRLPRRSQNPRVRRAVEEIDIGGPSPCAAAGDFRDVLVTTDRPTHPRVLTALDETPSLAFRFDLARKAIAHTAAYDTAIAATLATVRLNGATFERAADGPGRFGERLDLSLEKIRDLRYGENPHQRAAWYSSGLSGGGGSVAAGFGRTTILQGKELSYTNLLDLDAGARMVLEFDELAVVVEHQPGGAAIGSPPADAPSARDGTRCRRSGGVALNRRSIRAAASSRPTH